jgi:hypothetical protein
MKTMYIIFSYWRVGEKFLNTLWDLTKFEIDSRVLKSV